jgi:hypothetical protein
LAFPCKAVQVLSEAPKLRAGLYPDAVGSSRVHHAVQGTGLDGQAHGHGQACSHAAPGAPARKGMARGSRHALPPPSLPPSLPNLPASLPSPFLSISLSPCPPWPRPGRQLAWLATVRKGQVTAEQVTATAGHGRAGHGHGRSRSSRSRPRQAAAWQAGHGQPSHDPAVLGHGRPRAASCSKEDPPSLPPPLPAPACPVSSPWVTDAVSGRLI